MTNPKHIELLEQARAHLATDMLLKGTYGDFGDEGFHGCSVGCHLHHILPDRSAWLAAGGRKHKVVADYYEYPEWLAHLQDTIFEGLPNGESSQWHVQMAEVLAERSVPINWTKAFHRSQVVILRVAIDNAGSSADAVRRVMDLHIATETRAVHTDEWSEAAEAAAGTAAWTARTAAWSAASSARTAAWSARTAETGTAAEAEAFRTMRDGILKVLADA